jgi:hypothetical protein
MKGTAFLGLAFLIASAAPALATNVVVESWENTTDPMDGWTSPQGWVRSSSTTTGVTNGVQSLNMVGTAAPTYGQMLRSPFVQAYTTDLGMASAISWDVTNVYTNGAGSTGYYQQWDIDIYNADVAPSGMSLDGYNYQGVNTTGLTTLTVPISSSLASALAASSNPTQIVFQVGGGNSAGNDQFWIDNLNITVAPEPASAALLGLGALPLLAARRRR